MSGAMDKRAGLNSSEAAIVWAYARFGGDVDACGVLGADAARAVRAKVQAVMEAPDNERARLVETWRREDRRWDWLDDVARRLDEAEVAARANRLDPRWRNALSRLLGHDRGRPCPWHDNSIRTRRAIVWLVLGPLRGTVTDARAELVAQSGFDLEQLPGMTPGEREDLLRRLGVFQLVELARKQDRRSLARLRRALRDDDRQWFDTCIKQSRDIDRIERGQMREFFLTISRQEPDLTARLLHLGLYAIAVSAGDRFSRKLHHVATRLPATLETLLLHYHKLQQRALLPMLAPTVRRSLDLFVERHDAWTQSRCEVEGGQR